MRVLFVAVGEHAQALKALGTHPVEELVEVGLGFAGIAHNERGANGDSGNLLAHCRQKLVGLGVRGSATHAFKHVVGDVLQRNINVAADLRILANHVEHVLGEARGKKIVQTNPLDSVHRAQRGYQLRQAALSVDVESVVREILGDQNQLNNTFGGQLLGLGHEVLNGC